MNRKILAIHACCTAIAWSTASAALAQPSTGAPGAEAAAPREGDIIVTAQRRAESVQSVPLAITAVGGGVLANRQISDLQALGSVVPNVNLGQNLGQARIAIRGVGLNTINPGNEGRVAFHQDNVYISRPSAILGTFFDVERIEVLRGPQGTLYGRNAVAGAINLITRDPTDELSGYAEATIGNYSRVTLEGGVGGPVAEGISVRIAGQTNDRSGYGRNIFNNQKIDDQKTRGVRAKIKIESGDFDLVLSGDYSNEHDHAFHYHNDGLVNPSRQNVGIAAGGITTTNPRDLAVNNGPNFDSEVYGFSANASFDLGSGYKLTSITGYRNSYVLWTGDIDLTTARLGDYFIPEKSRQVTQELRLSRDFDRGNWIVGAYYFREKIDSLFPAIFNGFQYGIPDVVFNGYAAGGKLNGRGVALFGQFKYEIIDDISVTLGARYNWERKYVNEILQFDLARPYRPLPGSFRQSDPYIPIAAQENVHSEEKFTPKIGIEYKPSSDLLVYASFSRGYKAGSFNLGGVQDPFKAENLDAYEAGIKSTTLNGALRVNLSGFYYDYSNLQVGKAIGPRIVVENAAKARIYGVEAEIVAHATDHLRFDVNAGWLHARYLNFSSVDFARPELGEIDLSGNRLEQAPPYTVTAGAEYVIPSEVGTLTLRGEGFFSGKVYFTPFNVENIGEGNYALFNAFLNFRDPDNKLYGSLFVRNITDRTKRINAIAGATEQSSPYSGAVQAVFNPPRTFGIRVGYNF